jgi:hypothetical protein
MYESWVPVLTGSTDSGKTATQITDNLPDLSLCEDFLESLHFGARDLRSRNLGFPSDFVGSTPDSRRGTTVRSSSAGDPGCVKTNFSRPR